MPQRQNARYFSRIIIWPRTILNLAPDYPYPAAVEDVRSLYKYAADHAEELGIDADRIGLAGDSAGGTIAALVCNGYEKEKLIKPCLQMLVYPLTDADMGTQSMRKYTDTPFWDSTYMSLMWDIYFGDQNKGAFEDKTGCALKDDLKKEALPMHNALPSSIPDTYIETIWPLIPGS